jgi:DUF438 domain-containing protein
MKFKHMQTIDLMATGKIDTTITDIDMYADDWVEQAAEKVEAVEGDTYVRLNRGVLTVNQIDALLDSFPLEFSYIDSNNQFIYYNDVNQPEDMTAPSHPESVGQPLGSLHPKQLTKMVEGIVSQLRAGSEDIIRITHPAKGGQQFVVHNYQRMEDREGNYYGINEYVADLKPLVDYYLEQTGQKLVKDDAAQAQNSAKIPHSVMDALSGASQKTAPAVDSLSSASKNH